MKKSGWDEFWNCLTMFSLKRWGNSAETSFEIVLECFRWSDEEISLRQVSKMSDNLFVEAMRKVGWDEFWNCLTMVSLKRWGNSAEGSIEIVSEYFRWIDEEIRLRRVLKLSDNYFVEAMRNFGWDEFWNCLTMFSLKRWDNSAGTIIKIVLECFRWSDEEIRLRQVSKLSDNIFVEAMRKFVWDEFWNCLTMVSLKRWGNPAETSVETVLEYFRWSEEEIRLKQVLKLSDNFFVELIKKSGWDVFWNCLTIFSLKRWGISAKTRLKLSYNVFVEAMREFGRDKFWDRLGMFPLKWWRN